MSQDTESLLSTSTFISSDGDSLITSNEEEPRKQRPCPRCFKSLWRLCKKFFRSEAEEYKIIKITLGFPIGLLLAAGLYFSVILPLDLPDTTRQVLGAMIGIGLGGGFALSIQVRCISLLVLPTFFGKNGRSYIATFAIAYLISGPIRNIIMNGREVTRSLSCATELIANHSHSKWELRMKPIQGIMMDLQKEGFLMKEASDRIKRTFWEVRKEVGSQREIGSIKKRTERVDGLQEGNTHRSNAIDEKHNAYIRSSNKADKSEHKYEKKLDFRCEDVFNMGVVHCREKFKEMENDCLGKIPVIGYLLCLPLKLTIFCELVRLLPGVVGANCDSVEAINPGFGETYSAANSMIKEMNKNMDVNLQYKMSHTPEDIDYTTAEEASKGVAHEFESRRVWIDFVLTIIKRFLAFTFILVFIKAYKYNRKYLTDFRWDNHYVSRYFRHIDARRMEQCKKVLLPLKKSERSSMIFPKSPKLMGSEKSKLGKGTFLLIMRVATSAVIVFVDHVVFSVLEIIRTNSKIDYRQTGQHHIGVKIYGTGFISNIVRMFLKGFNRKHHIDVITTNFDCLPMAKKLDSTVVYYIFGVYAAVWLLIYLEAYGLRLRRIVASFFYRKVGESEDAK